jgi:transcriptional regulator with XRE-family HTH domain
MVQVIEFPYGAERSTTILREGPMTMEQMVATRIRELREGVRWTKAQLAKESRVSARTISRIEKGEYLPHRHTIDQLAKALGVDPGVLTGKKPMPAIAGRPVATAVEIAFPFYVRVHPAIRNSFELVARRYRVSVPTIARLAPLLFALVAEESLQHRREDLEELKAADPRLGEFESMMLGLRSKFPHIPFPDLDWTDQDEAIKAEKASIERRDLFGQKRFVSDWVEADDNPFEAYLKARAAIVREHELDRQLEAYARGEIDKLVRGKKPDAAREQIDAAIEANLDKYIEKYGRDWRAANRERAVDDLTVNAVGPTSADYRVCPSDALALAGEQELADSFLSGKVLIHQMLSVLTPEQRIARMRDLEAPGRKMEEEISEDVPGELYLPDIELELEY